MRVRSLAAFLLALTPAACVTAQEPSQETAPRVKPVSPERLRPTDSEALRAAAFAPSLLARRRRALVKALGADAVLVVAAGERGDDVQPFRPDPNFLYLSGQRDAGLSLLLTATEDVLFAPRRSAAAERWNGPSLAVGTALARASGFDAVVSRATRTERVQSALAAGGELYLSGLTLDDLGLEEASPPATPRQALASARQVKDLGEVALLQRTIDITATALTEAMRSIEPGQFEYEAQGVIEYLFIRYGAQRPGFVSIVGSGPNTCVLHYSANRRRMREGELVVLDVGAELWGYSADVTRTVPASGRFSPRQREVYEVVLRAQQAGFDAVKPGATLRAVDRAARKVITDAGYGEYFLHSTSHWLGLDVHDPGASGRALAPGMVLTVEPGIYLADEDLGVRIEDDVLVTQAGRRILSDGVPRTVPEIEALMRGDGVGARRVTPLPEREAPRAKQRRERFFQVR